MDATDLSPARDLLNAVTAYLDEHYRGWRMSREVLPDGLRVEMHPDVYYSVMGDPYTLGWEPSLNGLSEAFKLPVKVTTDLGSGHWRLVVVTEDVKLGGTLPIG